jgi:hypothetical protein
MLRGIKILFLFFVLAAFLTDLALPAEVNLFINEIMASNNSSIRDPQGQYDDWIEIYNAGTNSIHAGGMYLTDDLSVPNKWQIPVSTNISARGYLLIWADSDTGDAGLHTNFKLSSTGEQIGLFDIDGSTLIDSVVFDEQSTDVSFGRFPNGGDDWKFLSIPTPGEGNEGAYPGVVQAPQFSHERGFCDGPFSLTITTETEGASVFYTLDGSSPYDDERNVARGTYYTGPVPITTTTCIRAIAVKTDWKPSEIKTFTYIFLDDVLQQPRYPDGFPRSWGGTRVDYAMDQDVVEDPAYESTIKDDLKTIPSVCIVIDNDDFFDDDTGIYANTQRTGIDWERPASIEWVDPVNSIDFQVNAGLRVHGSQYGRSQGVGKHSLRMLFKNEYGPSQLDFPLFEDTDVTHFDTLVLRAIWNYSWFGDSTACGGLGTDHADYLRDQYARDTVRDMGGLAPHSRPVHVYINGLYWGMYILTERPDGGFLSENLDGNKEDYDVLVANGEMEVKSGDLNAWNALYNMARNDLSSTQAYDEIQQYVDIPAMIDYMLMIYYVGSRDAPVLLCNNNVPRNFYAARSREPAGPFLFIPWDVEWVLEWPDENRVNIVGVENPHYLINRLMNNADFRIMLADNIHNRFFHDGVLTTDRSTERYLIRAGEVDRAIIGESARWGDSRRSNRPYTRNNEWIGEVNRLVNEYFSVRTEIVLNQLRNAGFYPSVSAPEFYVNGRLQYGGMVNSGDVVSMAGSGVTIWYTLDGTDPRLPGTGAGDSTQYTLVTENAPKRVFVPGGEISSGWNSSTLFNDSSWISGTGAVGYEAGSGYEHLISIDIYNQMYNNVTGCYIRIPFDISQDPGGLSTMTLRMRYDDGFVAYINGIEVARANAPESLQWDSGATNINDDTAAVNFQDFDISSHMSDLRRGDNILAIHGLNAGLSSSDFLISTELIVSEHEPVSDLGVSPDAIEYTGPITLTRSMEIKARALSTDTWSALSDATFAIGPVAENLRITEIMYHPQALTGVNEPNEEFIELKNVGVETINLNMVRFTNGIDFTFPDLNLHDGEYVVVVQDRDAFESRYGTDINVAGEYSGRLDNGGERITLVDAAGQTILNFRYRDGWYDTTDGEGYSLTVAEPESADPNQWNDMSGWRPSVDIGGSPGWDDKDQIPRIGDIVINELLAHSHADAPDWIELHNPTDAAINVGGWFLSDSDADLMKYEIAEDTIVEPDGYVVFYEDLNFNNPNDPGCHEPFALSESGETLYLNSGQDGMLTGYERQEQFDASETAVAFGRYHKSTGSYNFVSMSVNTPGSANAYPKVGPIVINEIMYNPASGDQDEEYVELLNISDYPVILSEFDNVQLEDVPWRFTDDSNGIVFDFPLGTIIEPGEYLLLVKNENIFNLRYPAINRSAQVIEWGDGRLNNAGEKLQLSKPGEELEGTRYYIRVDRVNYSDGSHPDGEDPWPLEPDGGGFSLTKKESNDYGNDVDNWLADTPSPGY